MSGNQLKAVFGSYWSPIQLSITHRDLLICLIKRDSINRTSGTIIGGLWLIANPALQVLTFWFLLDYVLKVKVAGPVAFLDYFLVAIIPWLLLHESLIRSLSVMSEFSALYQKTIFPVEVLPLIPPLMAFCVYSPIYLVVTLIIGGSLWLSLQSFLVLVIFTIWLIPLCYFLSILGLFVKESRQILPFLLTMILYATPILYTVEALPQNLQPLMNWNLLAHVIRLFEWVVYGGSLSMDDIFIPAAFWLFSTPLSILLFKRAEASIREEL